MEMILRCDKRVHKYLTTVVRVGMVLHFCVRVCTAQGSQFESKLRFTSTSHVLQQTFDWAETQALAYSHVSSGATGPWYEAALPGRDAFCMRDVSHQAEAAAALGLDVANASMFHQFATSVSGQRDWAGYWEIDKSGRPSSADYVSDEDFWYNLPANFDFLDATMRLWRWTGNSLYRNGPGFQRSQRGTIYDYAKAWQLTPDVILSRPRIANQKLKSGKFVNSRGIPSYTEGPKDFILGTDLLASEYRALYSFQELVGEELSRNERQHLQKTAESVEALIEKVAWSPKQHHYLGIIHRDHTGSGSGDALLLYFGAIENVGHRDAALDYVSSPAYWQYLNIEEESYLPLTLFRYGKAGVAYQVMADLSSPTKERRDYPEVSFAVLEGFVSGVMGLQAAPSGASYEVSTFPQLPSEEERATLTQVAIKQNHVSIDQDGKKATKLTNLSGPTLHWRAYFAGNHQSLQVDGRQMSATFGLTSEGMRVSWVEVIVPTGVSVVVTQ